MIILFIKGQNNGAPKILDVSTNIQPGSLITSTDLYIEYYSEGNDDGFEATVTAQASRKSSFYQMFCPKNQ